MSGKVSKIFLYIVDLKLLFSIGIHLTVLKNVWHKFFL
jgi:hypothetical protein